jgi:hypothetical protein
MTSAIFEDWITGFDKKMRQQNRHVLLFLDNAPSHPKLTLNNVTLQFLPANTTSKSQPMDQGIIQALKLRYRRRQLQKTIMKMDTDKTLNGSDLLKQISVLDAIYWTSNSWNDLDNSTIQKCFKRCGFIHQENVEKYTDNESDDVPLIVLQMANDLFGISYKNLVEIDSELRTCDNDKTDWTQNAQDILFNKNDIEERSDEDDNVDDICTVVEMNQYTEKMKGFAIAHGDVQILAALNTIDERCTAICITRLAQAKITDFFKLSSISFLLNKMS